MIFEDPSNKRWKITISIFTILVIAIVLHYSTIYIYSFIIPPSLPSISKSVAGKVKTVSPTQAETKPSSNSNNLIRSAFVVQNDTNSINTLKNHINDLDIAFLDIFSFTGKEKNIKENINAELLNLLKDHKIKIFPRITNLDVSGNQPGADFAAYIKLPENRTALCSDILSLLEQYDFKGINLDFQFIPNSSKDDYISFLMELSGLLHNNSIYITINVPIGDDILNYKAIGEVADMIVIKPFDEHYPEGPNGPIASQNWFTNELDKLKQKIHMEKVIISLGQYAYDWNITRGTAAESLSIEEATSLSKEFRAPVRTDSLSINSTFSYMSSGGEIHDVWMLDAVSMWNELQLLKDYPVYGVALCQIGLEDPTIWDFFTTKDLNNVSPSILDRITTSETISNEGLDDRPKVVLTFDDGPSLIYTNQILDILEKHNVTATFFVLGKQAQLLPQVIERAAKEGHLIGNHTYSHLDITKISNKHLNFQINFNQRLIQAITGRGTVLFRPPYQTNLSPGVSSGLMSLYNVSNLDYIAVSSNIDSLDYKEPGTDNMVKKILSELNLSGTNIILMHDSGGNRSQTVEALDKLIPMLKAKGYKFVNMNALLGVYKSDLMPVLDSKERFILWNYKLWIWFKNNAWHLLNGLFFISTTIAILRILYLSLFVMKSRKKQKNYQNIKKFEPFVSVLVPAYNEEKVIQKTLQALCKSNYSNFEVLVIDDGSTDNTRKVTEQAAETDARIRVISKPNGGKASALNLGFKTSKAKYIVTIDADTIVLPNTIRNLVSPFADPIVDGVCGNVKVGNVKNILTGFQAVEYITAQNYERMAFDALNCISVVPGATGAWRRKKVLNAGGYSDSTLTEDADLTLTMLEKGSRIVYSSSAISITEAPESVKDLYKQRFRWTFGTYQSLWKHRKPLFKGMIGWIPLPDMLMSQVVLPILAPIGDMAFIYSIFTGEMQSILYGYLLFLLMDFAASITAFKIDKAPYKYLWFILIQRFFYRQFLYIVVLKSIIASIRGRTHGWNKLNRTSSISIDTISGEVDTLFTA